VVARVGDQHVDERVREGMAIVDINGLRVQGWDPGRVREVLESGLRPLSISYR
jgi:hypothetical protein